MPPTSLPWTGERMVPTKSDAATELYHWQRYLYFRPWYDGARVLDAASGEGYGTAFAATYAEWARGIDLDSESVIHATARYPQAEFQVADVVSESYADADLVLSFETIEHLPDPRAFLDSLRACEGRIVISTPNRKTHSPGNSQSDAPRNPFHTVEWTPLEFADLIRAQFPDRTVRFLSQSSAWPGLISQGLDDEAMYCIAVIGEGELPKWPRIGLAMPVLNNVDQAVETIVHLSRFYPGELKVCVAANGLTDDALSPLTKLQESAPYMVNIVRLPENRGYGGGANAALAALWSEGGFDYYGVTNDDVVAAPHTLLELASCAEALRANGHKIGTVGPVSNNVNGAQKVDFPPVGNLEELLFHAEQYHLEHHSEIDAAAQVRGLFTLWSPECLDAIGGFDPRFGIGNFEDDDHNLRCLLAGFPNWIARGAFLYHHGSQTFARLFDNDGGKYNATIERNREVFCWKWDLTNLPDWVHLTEAPFDMSLYAPFDAIWKKSFPVVVDDQEIDLLTQASDVEFVKWVYDRMKVRDRDIRGALVKVLMESAPHLAAVNPVGESDATPQDSRSERSPAA